MYIMTIEDPYKYSVYIYMQGLRYRLIKKNPKNKPKNSTKFPVFMKDIEL